MRVRVRAWSAWSPGLEEREGWERWLAAPSPLAAEGVPEVDFLPAAMRRRCTRLTKMMLRVAFDCCDEATRARALTVFASRHGAIHVAVKILETIARKETVSPMQFSHSVHNAQAGLFSIAAGNRAASSSLAAEADTFAHGYLESLLLLERNPDTPVLLVTGDEPIPDNLSHLIEEPPGAYAIGLLLERAGEHEAGAIALTLDAGEASAGASAVPDREPAWPQAAQFLHWLERGGTQLQLGQRCSFRWTREAAG